MGDKMDGLLELLRSLEYIDTNKHVQGEFVCPWCGAPRVVGHHRKCKLSIILRGLEGAGSE